MSHRHLFYMLVSSLDKHPGHVYGKVMAAVLLDRTLLDPFQHGASFKEIKCCQINIKVAAAQD